MLLSSRPVLATVYAFDSKAFSSLIYYSYYSFAESTFVSCGATFLDKAKSISSEPANSLLSVMKGVAWTKDTAGVARFIVLPLRVRFACFFLVAVVDLIGGSSRRSPSSSVCSEL